MKFVATSVVIFQRSGFGVANTNETIDPEIQTRTNLPGLCDDVSPPPLRSTRTRELHQASQLLVTVRYTQIGPNSPDRDSNRLPYGNELHPRRLSYRYILYKTRTSPAWPLRVWIFDMILLYQQKTRPYHSFIFTILRLVASRKDH